MRIKTKDLTLIAMLAALLAVSGSIRIPLGLPGSEFQLSAPLAVAIVALFGFWRYLTAGLLASGVLLILGIHNLINFEVSMIFRIVAGVWVGLLGPSLPVVALAGPLGSIAARWGLSLTLDVPFLPLYLATFPGIILTAITSWPLYKLLKRISPALEKNAQPNKKLSS